MNINTGATKTGAQSGNWIGAAAGAATGLLGMLGQKKREKRQLGYQKELMGLQQRHQEMLNKQGFDLQKRMWEETNYPAQMKMLQEAGLNPSLLYGMGGAGGSTTGSQGGGSAASGAAPITGSIPMEIGAALSTAKLASEIDLLKSQAKKNNVEAEKTATVDTEETKTRIQDLAQGIENKKAQFRLTEAQTEYQKLENYITNKSKDDKVDEIKYSARTMLYEMGIARSEDIVNRDTIDARIKQASASAIGAVINNMAMQKGIELDTAKIREISESISQKYIALGQSGYALGQKDKEIRQKDRDLVIKQFDSELKALMPGVGNFAGYMLSEISDIGAYIDDFIYGTDTRRKKKID